MESLIKLTKKAGRLGMDEWNDATPRQRQGLHKSMAWIAK